MKKKIFFIILSVMCFIAAAVFVIVGVRRTNHPAVIDGLVSLGELTLEAYDAGPDESGDGQYTIFYRYIDPKYGEIVFANSVDSDDYYSYMFDQMRIEQAENTEVPKENNEEAKKTSIKRYVYVYPENGRYEAAFQDRYMGLTDVSELIDPSPKVSSTYYYIVSGILMLGGAYMLFLALAGKRSKN